MALEITPGSEFAGHRIEGVAGHGGMGVVYRATDLMLERTVALKLIAPSLAEDPVFRTRFEHECRVAAAIDHPNVVQVFHAGEERGVLYVTMRFVEGTDLRNMLEECTRLQPGRALALVEQVAAGLDEAHRHGLVHRDVKPGNVLVATRAGRDHAFLTDFGLTKRRVADVELTRPGFAIGTADYMAPEQARGAEVDARADIYALACLLYRILTGAVPYDRDSDLDKLFAHVHEPPPSLRDASPELPEALEQVLHKALAKAPEERYASAGEFAQAALAAFAPEPAPDQAPAAAAGGLRVVVAEDSLLLRAGVVHVLQDAGFQVVAEAGDAEELLREVRTHKPDVAVTDIRMPPTHSDEGLRAARTIRTEMPGTGVLVLSQYAEEAYAVELLGEGAEGVGYLLKDRVADPRGFADAVRQVGRGGSALDPEVVAQMLSHERADDPLQRLSDPELKVLARMAQGQSNQRIGEELELGERAVERHVSAIFSKLDLPAGTAGHRRVLAVLTYLGDRSNS
jgi:DNA-binding NarL/FixJ family response regulator